MTKITFKDTTIVEYPSANFINRRDDGVLELRTGTTGEIVAEISEADVEQSDVIAMVPAAESVV